MRNPDNSNPQQIEFLCLQKDPNTEINTEDEEEFSRIPDYKHTTRVVTLKEVCLNDNKHTVVSCSFDHFISHRLWWSRRHAHPKDNHKSQRRDGGRDHHRHSKDGGGGSGGRDDRGRESSMKEDSRSSSRPKSRHAPSVGRLSKEKKQYDTPFDAKERCHNHANIQLVKKKLTVGWKVCYIFFY